MYFGAILLSVSHMCHSFILTYIHHQSEIFHLALLTLNFPLD